MDKKILIILALLASGLFSCIDSDPMYEQVTVVKTPLQRVSDLNKTPLEIKKSEEKAALVRQENDFLEYEYPIQEDESYIVSYRFDEEGCFEIGFDTYFNKEEEAKNVVNGILSDLKQQYGDPKKEIDFYSWELDGLTIELDIHNVERGMIALTYFATK